MIGTNPFSHPMFTAQFGSLVFFGDFTVLYLRTHNATPGKTNAASNIDFLDLHVPFWMV